MTYYESYKSFNKFEDFEKEVKLDISTALFMNKDRIKPILNAANQVANENGWIYNFSKEVK